MKISGIGHTAALRSPLAASWLRRSLVVLTLLLAALPGARAEGGGATVVEPPYEDPKVVVEFYFDRPEKAAGALHWLRAFINPLMEEPYGMAPEFMNIVVVIHGTELVTVANRNYDKYKTIVDRMKYYAQLGVKFRVCGLAAEDYGYTPADLQDFIEVAPSAMTELVHWQQQGYALLIPQVPEKHFTIEEIR
ncbi:MAG: DsrE family protein [Gammaproteobacteria bacterium]|nr:DsrE family protein [Gammaproteobacteria bacterium]